MRTSVKFLFPLLLAPTLVVSPAHAGSCPLTNLLLCNTFDNNVQFSNFSFTGFTANTGDTFVFIGDSTGNGSVTVNFNPGRQNVPNGASFSYTATLLPTSSFKYTFDTARISANNNFATSGDTMTTTYTSSGLPLFPTLTETGTSFNRTNQNTPFNPGLTSLMFTQTFQINALSAGNVATQSISGAWSARANPVPGPLPLLGAATAFGLSRKLRSRIRSAA